MQIKTSKGGTHDVLYIGAPLRNVGKIMIELADDRPFHQIAADFDGLEIITHMDDVTPGKEFLYRGYTRLVGMQINENTGTVRLTLKKGDAA